MKPIYEELEQQLAESHRALRAETAAHENTQIQLEKMASENAGLKSIVDFVTDLDNEPQYHEQGMGCGLEDRGITDRYEAMSHGWEQAMERVYGEVIPCAEEIAFPETSAFLAEVRAQGVEMFAAHKRERQQALRSRSMRMSEEAAGMAADAEEFAAQLRKGVQS